MIDEEIVKQEQKIANLEREIEEKVAEQVRNYGRPLGHKVLADKLEAAKRQLERLKAKKTEEVTNHPFLKKDRQTIQAVRENNRHWNTSTKGKRGWDNRFSGSRSQRNKWRDYYNR